MEEYVPVHWVKMVLEAMADCNELKRCHEFFFFFFVLQQFAEELKVNNANKKAKRMKVILKIRPTLGTVQCDIPCIAMSAEHLFHC